MPDDTFATRQVEDIPVPLVYEEGPRPEFVFDKLLEVGGVILVRSLLGCTTRPVSTNRKGKGRPRGWRPQGPGFSRNPKVGRNWVCVDQGTWFDQWGTCSTLADMVHDDPVRCKLCDLTSDGLPIGDCSAHVVKKPPSEGVWCWSCETQFWEEDSIPRLVPSWPPARDFASRSSLGGSVMDVSESRLSHCLVNGLPRCTRLIPEAELTRCRVTCVDAPTGFGKTYLLVDYVKRYPSSNVMVIVSWQSLCSYYKSLLDKETRFTWSLYLDEHVQEWNLTQNRHAIVCYPSLRQIDERMVEALSARGGWGLWIDEAVKLSHFSASSSIFKGDAMRDCESRLTSLLRVAPWCVLLQYNMSMDTPAWITDRFRLHIVIHSFDWDEPTLCIP